MISKTDSTLLVYSTEHILVKAYKGEGGRHRHRAEGEALDREFNEELESHLAMLVEDYVGRGMSLEQALRRARLDLGERAQLVDAHRAVRGLPLLDTLLHDFSTPSVFCTGTRGSP